MVLWQYRGTIQALAVLALCLWAFRRGAAPEKAASATLLLMVIVVWLYRWLLLDRSPGNVIGGFFGVEVGYFATDLIGFASLFAISLRANRIYPLWMAGFQLTAVATHFATGIAAQALPRAYALLNLLPFYFVMAAFVAGMIAHQRRERRIGPYRSWRTGFEPLQAITRIWPQAD